MNNSITEILEECLKFFENELRELEEIGCDDNDYINYIQSLIDRIKEII